MLVPRKATGNLAVNSFTFPNIKKDKFSIQKKRGGFSKKYSPFKYRAPAINPNVYSAICSAVSTVTGGKGTVVDVKKL